jgi:hypothetical protein
MWEFKQFKYIEEMNPGFIIFRRKHIILIISVQYSPLITRTRMQDALQEPVTESMNRSPLPVCSVWVVLGEPDTGNISPCLSIEPVTLPRFGEIPQHNDRVFAYNHSI